MNEDEGFAARWSRLKRSAADKKKSDADANRKPGDDVGGVKKPASLNNSEAPDEPFDVSSLPSIESITADSDIRAFLQQGVPATLARAALRKAWTTDPAIRDFIGLAENQWDFTDPTAMPGFGPLEATDDVAKLVAQAMGRLDGIAGQEKESTDFPAIEPAIEDVSPSEDGASVPAEGAGASTGYESCERSALPGETEDQQSFAAAQQERDTGNNLSTLGRRGHGGALPT